jgi:HTH-type transcriptional regulator, transcriptional repressor of NAD biosynthesis genes
MAARAPRASGGGGRLKTVCLHGSESTGKTTLARELAKHFKTIMVPEFGRLYCEVFGNDCDLEDLRAIRRGHDLMAAAGRRKANKILILDTDAIMTAVWADVLLGARPPDLDRIDDPADFYLLCDIDVPFEADAIRYFPDVAMRKKMFDQAKEELEKRNLPFSIIRGTRAERLSAAIAAIANRFPEIA